MEINGYQLSRAWFDFCFDNPEKINPAHTAIFFFAIEHCNRLGWKQKFGFPSQMTMDAIGIKKHHTYIKYFNDLVEWGFIELIEKSKNQYSSNIICLSFAKPKKGKALGKALAKHAAKHGQSTGCIDKPLNLRTNKPLTEDFDFSDWEFWGKQIVEGNDQYWEQMGGRKIQQSEMDSFLSVATRNEWKMDSQQAFRISLKGFHTNGTEAKTKRDYKIL